MMCLRNLGYGSFQVKDSGTIILTDHAWLPASLHAIVSIALSCTIFELIDFEEHLVFKSRLASGHSPCKFKPMYDLYIAEDLKSTEPGYLFDT